MAWFFKKKEEQKINNIDISMRHSFELVKRDTHSIFEWLNYLYHRSAEQDKRIYELQTQINYIPKTREELRALIDAHYSLDPILNKMDELKSKLDALEASQKPIKEHVSQHDYRLETLEKPKLNFKERLIQKIAKSSKEHVKTIIRNLIIKYGTVSALNLREIVVEEQALTSKSSFYRILEEIEQEEGITVIHDKKEKKYVYQTALKSSYSKT